MADAVGPTAHAVMLPSLTAAAAAPLMGFALLVTCLSTATAIPTLIPANAADACPYIAENCTQLELLPVERNDTCHRSIAAGFAQEIAAADTNQVSWLLCSARTTSILSIYNIEGLSGKRSVLQGVDVVFYGRTLPRAPKKILSPVCHCFSSFQSCCCISCYA